MLIINSTSAYKYSLPLKLLIIVWFTISSSSLALIIAHKFLPLFPILLYVNFIIAIYYADGFKN